MNVEREVKTWALCPSCSGRVGTVDHLDVGAEAGPWFCDGCGRGWWLTVTTDGVTHRAHDYVRERTVVTLELPPQRSPVVLTLDGFRIVKPGEDHDGDAYFYDEHTCPTNWLRNVTEVRFEGSDDPHGLFRWVSTEPDADAAIAPGEAMTSCPTCAAPFVSHGESTQTCMGGIDSLGHGHNPNATMREFAYFDREAAAYNAQTRADEERLDREGYGAREPDLVIHGIKVYAAQPGELPSGVAGYLFNDSVEFASDGRIETESVRRNVVALKCDAYSTDHDPGDEDRS